MMLALLLALQAPVAPWHVGDRVHTTGNVYARADSTPTGTALFLHIPGEHGTIIGGPAKLANDAYSWRWKVDYDAGADGWSAQLYLALDAPAPPPPPPPPPAPPPAPPPPPPPPPSGLHVSAVTLQPRSLNLTVGVTAQLYAVTSWSDGTARPGNARLTWSSTQPGVVAAVQGQPGVVRAIDVGGALVLATDSSGAADSISVVVTPATAGTFGLRASGFSMLGCPPTVGTKCSPLPIPVFDDATGSVLARALVTVTFLAP